MSENGPFLVRYFSDGTYDAYMNSQQATGDPSEAGKETDPIWGSLLTDNPIKGTWESSDGFFTLVKDDKRTYVGSVQFEAPVPGGLAPSGWEAGIKGNEFVLEDGNMCATGPALFRGLAYSGTPGGKLQAL